LEVEKTDEPHVRGINARVVGLMTTPKRRARLIRDRVEPHPRDALVDEEAMIEARATFAMPASMFSPHSP
jgi:hypothetical protein